MKILILEDDGARVNNFIELLYNHDLDITENAHKAVSLLETEKYDLLLLDHDLGENNGNGTVVSNFLNKFPNNPNIKSMILIHSWNTPGALSMLNDLPHAKWAPYNTEKFYDLIIKYKRGID